MPPASVSSCATDGRAGTRKAAFSSIRPKVRQTISADATVLALGGASWPQLGSDGAWVDAISGAGVGVAPLQAGKLRVCGSMVGHFSHALRRPAAEAFGAFVRRPEGARRSPRHRDRFGRRRHLCAVGAAARGHCRHRRSAPAHRLAPRRDACAIWLRVSPRRARSSRFRHSCAKPRTCRRLRSACCRRRPWRRRSILASMAPAALADLVKAVPVRLTGTAPIARAISTAGGIAFDRGRRALHAAPPAGRLRCRRDAGLGSADRRLSAAGVLCDGRGRREWCTGMAGRCALRMMMCSSNAPTRHPGRRDRARARSRRAGIYRKRNLRGRSRTVPAAPRLPG